MLEHSWVLFHQFHSWLNQYLFRYQFLMQSTLELLKYQFFAFFFYSVNVIINLSHLLAFKSVKNWNFFSKVLWKKLKTLTFSFLQISDCIMKYWMIWSVYSYSHVRVNAFPVMLCCVQICSVNFSGGQR